jgi:hypothetical protein
MSISSTGPSGSSRRLRLAGRQVIGRHRIVVIRQSGGHTEWGVRCSDRVQLGYGVGGQGQGRGGDVLA